MGETGVCRIRLVPLKRHRSFSWIPDKRVGDGDNGNNGIKVGIKVFPREEQHTACLYHVIGWSERDYVIVWDASGGADEKRLGAPPGVGFADCTPLPR